MQDLYSGDLDLVIRMGELADSRLVARRVADNWRILAASPAYLKAHGSPAQPEELERHNCLVFACPGLLQSTWPLRKGRREKPVAVSGTLCSDNVDVLHAWCVAGLGWASRCARPGTFTRNCATGGWCACCRTGKQRPRRSASCGHGANLCRAGFRRSVIFCLIAGSKHHGIIDLIPRCWLIPDISTGR